MMYKYDNKIKKTSLIIQMATNLTIKFKKYLITNYIYM